VKKIVSIVILSLFLMHLVGFYVYFVVRQGQIRQEMREAIGYLPAEEFETFVFTEAEYQQIKVNANEVKIDGKMYDHSAPQFEDGKVTIFARHDQDEDNLISFLHEVVNAAAHDEEPVPSQLFNFFSLTFITDNPISLTSFFSAEKLYYPASEELTDWYTSVTSPPPKV
jgi:hypothetical protein